MKTKTILLAVIVCVFTSSWSIPVGTIESKLVTGIKAAKAKPPAGFKFFRTHRQGRYGVASTWGMINAQGITGFILQRTYEWPDEFTFWENIYQTGAGNGNFGFVDTDVFPGIINYRVLAVNGSAVVCMSDISSVQIRQH